MDDATIAAEVRAQIDEYGWAVITHDGEPTIAYTVGLHAKGHPEIVVVGLPPDMACDLLGECGADVENGCRFEPGTRTADLLDDYEVRFGAIAAPTLAEVCLGAVLHYGEGAFTAIQLIWPDPAGCFPGEAEVDPDMAECQPLLA